MGLKERAIVHRRRVSRKGYSSEVVLSSGRTDALQNKGNEGLWKAASGSRKRSELRTLPGMGDEPVVESLGMAREQERGGVAGCPQAASRTGNAARHNERAQHLMCAKPRSNASQQHLPRVRYSTQTSTGHKKWSADKKQINGIMALGSTSSRGCWRALQLEHITEQLEHTTGQLGVSIAQLALNTEFGNSNTKPFDETTVPSDENTAYLKDTAASFRVMVLADDPTSASVNAATNSL